jgi:hypothetical protein
MIFPTIKLECSQFIKESNGIPIFKNLPKNKEAFVKIKARHRKTQDEQFRNAFDGAFKEQKSNLLSRAVFCNAKDKPTDNEERFYVFPINGYKFLYNKNDKNTSKTYQNALTEIIDIVAQNEAINLLTTILESDYISESLTDAIQNDREIIFYNIAYFYAIKVELFPTLEDYKNIIYN